MTKRGELKNISKVIEEVFSQKQIRVGIDNIRVKYNLNINEIQHLLKSKIMPLL